MTPQKDENVIKHLQMIQDIISRLAQNSFLIKGWSLTLIAFTLLLIFRTDAFLGFILVLAVPVLGFWGLDGYFLRQERLFRHIYNDVRTWEETDFSMPVFKHANKETWLRATFSRTLVIFYLMELFFIFVSFFTLFCFPIINKINS